MYVVNDKKSAIKEVQKFLYEIAQTEADISYVTIDGYYSEQTRLAVTEFQRLKSIEENGRVDKQTFDLLYSAYIDALNTKLSSDFGLNSLNFPLKMGDSGNDVSILNSILRELGTYYRELAVPYGDFFSNDTEQAVNEMQRHLLLEESGTVSESFLGRLKKEVTGRENFKQTK